MACPGARTWSIGGYVSGSYGRFRSISLHAQLLAVSAVWGSTFVLVKDAVAGGDALTFVALRFSLAGCALVVVLHRRLGEAAAWRAGSAVGVVLFTGFALQTLGLRYTTATKAGFLTGMYIPLVPIVAWAATRRPPSGRELLAVGTAAVGMGLLMLPVGSAVSFNVGDALIVGCAVAFAAHIVALGQVAARYSVATLATAQVLTTAMLATGAALLWEWPVTRPSSAFLGAAVFTGIVATAVAFAIQTASQRRISATRTALIFATEPLFAAAFGVAFAGERLSAADGTGALLIVTSMLMVVGAPAGGAPTTSTTID
jgi:drug/metabolite transporter (DMT)-like permease